MVELIKAANPERGQFTKAAAKAVKQPTGDRLESDLEEGQSKF